MKLIRNTEEILLEQSIEKLSTVYEVTFQEQIKN